jgi:NADH-quinone oxidoreductase subunit E
MAFALNPEREKQVTELLKRYPTKRAALLPLLWMCQRDNGWVSPEVIDYAAGRLELSTAVVKGVVTFYTMFFEKPVGKNVVWVCRTLSCDLRGAKAIEEHLEKRFSCHVGQTSADGRFTLLRAECLAACGQAPMVQINDAYFENLDTAKLDQIIDGLGEAREPRTSVPSASVARSSVPSAGAARSSVPSASAGTGTASRAPSVAPKPASVAPKPASVAPRPASEAPKPASEAPKPASEAPKPASEAPKPASEAPKPASVAPKPASEAPKPVSEAPKPVSVAADAAGAGSGEEEA